MEMGYSTLEILRPIKCFEPLFEIIMSLLVTLELYVYSSIYFHTFQAVPIEINTLYGLPYKHPYVEYLDLLLLLSGI